MRQIILDTETTGLSTEDNHRIIEIGCVELVDRRLTGNNFHQYINPKREIDAGALSVHGITNEFLKDKPTFAEIYVSFLHYIADAEIIAHNARFDIGFISHEIKSIPEDADTFMNRITVIDSLAIARKLFPGQRNSLDALCKRYQVDTSSRNLHGALLDANLLATVYLRMTGGQINLFSQTEVFTPNQQTVAQINTANNERKQRTLPIIHADAEEISAHELMLAKITKTAKKCLWTTQKAD